MKRGQIKGLLSCDPSWRGLAFTIYIPFNNYQKSYLFDLKDFTKCKDVQRPKTYTPLIVGIVDRLLDDDPMVRLVDRVIIENQFSDNMKKLMYIITACLLSKLPGSKIEYLSALTCKRKNGVPYNQNHYNNKKAMVEFVRKNSETLIAGSTLIDHNTADSIILLNTWLSLKPRRLCLKLSDFAHIMSNVIHTEVPFALRQKQFICPRCEQPRGKLCVVKNPPKDPTKKDNRGNFFLTCDADIDGVECKGFLMLSKRIPVIVDNKLGDIYKGEWRVYNPNEDTVVELTPLGKRTNSLYSMESSQVCDIDEVPQSKKPKYEDPFQGRPIQEIIQVITGEVIDNINQILESRLDELRNDVNDVLARATLNETEKE